MTQTETHRDSQSGGDAAVAEQAVGGARQGEAYRSGFFRGAIIGVIASVPIWILIAAVVLWLLR